MRTKTLLLAAAAALAAGISTSQAQVYSANVVGYINVVVPAGRYAILGNQLINGSDANQTNNDINASLVKGFVSDPNGPPNGSNSVFLSWNGTGYGNPVYFFTAADATTWEGFASPAGWYDQVGNYAAIKLNQGKAAFIKNASSGPMTNTLVGTVLQGTNTTPIPSGYNLISLQEPIATNQSVAAYGLPPTLTSDPNGPPSGTNDIYLSWSGTGFNNPYYWFNATDATTWEGFASPAGWYDQVGNPLPNSLTPNVAQGFFLKHFGASVTWTNSFIVQ